MTKIENKVELFKFKIINNEVVFKYKYINKINSTFVKIIEVNGMPLAKHIPDKISSDINNPIFFKSEVNGDLVIRDHNNLKDFNGVFRYKIGSLIPENLFDRIKKSMISSIEIIENYVNEINRKKLTALKTWHDDWKKQSENIKKTITNRNYDKYGVLIDTNSVVKKARITTENVIQNDTRCKKIIKLEGFFTAHALPSEYTKDKSITSFWTFSNNKNKFALRNGKINDFSIIRIGDIIEENRFNEILFLMKEAGENLRKIMIEKQNKEYIGKKETYTI